MNVREELLGPVLDFLFPPVCPGCTADLSPLDGPLCRTCQSALVPVRTGDPEFLSARDRLMGDGEIDGISAVWHFVKGGPLQGLLHLVKYSSHTSLGEGMGRELGNRVTADRLPADVLVPVPLHPAKFRERGYNQSTAIARGVGVVTGLPIRGEVLRRVRYTSSQTHLSIGERALNVAGAFAVPPHFTGAVHQASIILVDDVITTGATIRECARALKNAGAEKVYVGAIALAESNAGSGALP
jgi:ComF family protein